MTIRGISSTRVYGFGSVESAHAFQNRNVPRFGFFNQVPALLYRHLPPPVNMRIGGMSIEDFTNRLMVWTIYIPQGIMAIRYKQHPFETWGRNIVIWLGMLGVTLFGKHPKYGFNALFNPFMQPKKLMKPLPDTVNQRLRFLFTQPRQAIETAFINPLRIDANYLEIAKRARIRLEPLGVKGSLAKAALDSFWSKFDVNEHNRFLEFADSLVNKAKTATNSVLRSNLLAEADLVKKISNRISLCKFMAFGASAVLMAVFVGVVLQKLVFTFIAPLDRKFVPTTSLKDLPLGRSDRKGGGG